MGGEPPNYGARFRLDGLVALITDATSPGGVAIAEHFAHAGANVVLCAARGAVLTQAQQRVEAAGALALPVTAELGQARECERVVAEAIERLGIVDVLVDLTDSYWIAHACGRVMRPGASMIVVGDAARAHVLAQRWTRSSGIRVNALAAGCELEAQAAAAVFLASGAASYVSGAALPVQ